MENTYIALLRGINVSGRNIIRMAELRNMMDKLGFPGAATYIQSGNIIFNSTEHDKGKLEADLASGILTRFGFAVPVLVLSSAEMRQSLSECPFADDGESKPVSVYITYMSETPRDNIGEELADAASSLEQWKIKGRFFYLNCPSGYGRTKLTNEFIEKRFGVKSTTRNIRTARKLLAIAEEKESLQRSSD